MEPTGRAGANAAGYQTVAAKAKIASFAAAIVDAAQPFAVVDPEGAIIGEVTPAAVIDLLSGKDRGGTA